ncbi:COX5A-domain-containing protein [Clavulina sp. PMI_390]|nr:COX5A-domain-containing protein [Clavulina sp. PMI_390]
MSRAFRAVLPALRASRTVTPISSRAVRTFATSSRALSGGHEAESYESFTERYTTFFQSVEDLFELQRGLNNCFAYDLVPAPGVIEAALRAARRVDDYSTAVRIFEGIKSKVENKSQYDAYLKELQGVKQELGIETKEELYGL